MKGDDLSSRLSKFPNLTEIGNLAMRNLASDGKNLPHMEGDTIYIRAKHLMYVPGSREYDGVTFIDEN